METLDGYLVNRRWINVIRYWNRVLSFDNERITRNVFEIDYNRCRNNWCSDLKEIFHCLDLDYYFDSRMIVDTNLVQSKIHFFYSNFWNSEMSNIPKLRTYALFKTVFGRENNVVLDMPQQLRSILAQFRCGILPLKIETGRYHGEPVEERICTFCCKNSIENEIHFLLHCPLYNDYRRILFENTGFNQLIYLSDTDALIVLISNYPRQVAKYLYHSFTRRQSLLFRK